MHWGVGSVVVGELREVLAWFLEMGEGRWAAVRVLGILCVNGYK